MNLKDLKKDCAQKQQKGIHFIIASVVIWIMVLIVQLTDLPMLTKNLLTLCCTAPLLPIAFLIEASGIMVEAKHHKFTFTY